MLGNTLNHIINFFYVKRFYFIVLLFTSLGIFTLGINKITFNENIFSALPKGNSFSKFTKLIDKGGLSNQVVLSLNIDSDDFDEITSIISDSLTHYTGNYLKDIIIERPEVERDVYNYFYNNFPIFIDGNYYQNIENKIQKDSIGILLSAAQRNLLAPEGLFVREFILNDPISISAIFFKDLNKESNFSNITVENGFVFNEDKNKLLMTAKTTFNVSDNKKNIALYHALNSFKESWNVHYPDHQFDYFGTFQIAAENSIQVKKDTYLTLFITLVIILLILFIFYRKILIPLYFMFPLIFGGMFALGMIGYFKSEISGISIATGAVVFGIILDYSFHFFTHLQHTKSIKKTISEISAPLLTGGFTTIMAFGALIFTNSVVLQDFGLFAALSLSGAAFFTLIGLPIILKLVHFNYEDRSRKNITFNFAISDRYRKPFIIVIIALTGVFLYFAFDIQFDGNLDNLSFHNQDLKDREEELMGINPEIEKKLFLFAEAKTYDEATLSNHNLYLKIKELQLNGKIKSSFSAAKFIVPDSIAKYRLNHWENFWLNRKENFVTKFNHSSDSLGFNKVAFNSFKEWISLQTVAIDDYQYIFKTLGLTDLVHQNKNRTSFITTVVVNNEYVKEVQHELMKVSGVTTFNRSEVATELLSSVKDDFNYILLVSSLLVFISLLIIYGRIEMALFTFLPMVISWIWILGIASIFSLKFNFVNIVIATFIFGLGDDFSIFVTDGLLHKYKHKKNTLKSYNTAIILSALTTMVGTGVLFFAKHPAIHSVSVISVLGILCILLISMTVQPILFRLFVQKRVDNKQTPLTLVAFMVSIFEFPWFVFGCLFSYIILAILFILPLPKKRKRLILNTVLSYSAWSVMYSAFHVRKKIVNLKNLDLKNPSIIITNHTSFLDILLMLMLNPKIIIVVKDWVYNSFLFGPIVRYAGYVYVGDGPEKNLDAIKKRIKEGYSLLIFPEGSRGKDDKLRRFHKGAFFLAKELNLDITPVLIHGPSYVLPKSEYFVRKGSVNLKILPRIQATDISWGETFGKRTKSISKYFKQEYLKFKDEQETSMALFSRVFSNYVYKGPILEWYLKIKWKFEAKNYDYYDSLLKGKKHILDIGCGYGYLSYYLHYKDENRRIIGLDYDEDKISIATNGFDKTDNLTFEHVDVNTYPFIQHDAILLNDVLHYFPKQKQQQLLDKCALALSSTGILLIRDGITNLENRHKKTQTTERFSTKILSFNKKESDFHFFSSDYIQTFAEKYNFSVQIVEQSSKTSNVLFILKKR